MFLDAISGRLDVLVDFGGHSCNSLIFPQPRWCFALNLEDEFFHDFRRV